MADKEFGYMLVDTSIDEILEFDTLKEAEDHLNTVVDADDLGDYKAFKYQRVKIAEGRHRIVDLQFKSKEM